MTKNKKPLQEITKINIEQHILLIRDEKVMLDSDLAELYGVETKVLLQSVKRNIDSFPDDFMFRLSKDEFKNLRSHFVTSNLNARRYAPYVFTEQGVAMLSSVLRSKRATQFSVQIMRTFVQFCRIFTENKALEKHLIELEQKYDKKFKVVFDAIGQLMLPDNTEKNPIGFIWQQKSKNK